MTIGERIKLIRKAHGLTQDMLAEMTGLSRITLSTYESGKADTNLKSAVLLADALGVTLDSLIGREAMVIPPDEDTEISKMRDEIRKNPSLRILFDVSKKARPKDIQAAINLIRFYAKDEENE